MRNEKGFVYFYLFGMLAAVNAMASFAFLELFSQWQKNVFECRREIFRELRKAAEAKQPHEVIRSWSTEFQSSFGSLLENGTLAGSCHGTTRQKGKIWEIVLSEDRSLSSY